MNYNKDKLEVLLSFDFSFCSSSILIHYGLATKNVFPQAIEKKIERESISLVKASDSESFLLNATLDTLVSSVLSFMLFLNEYDTHRNTHLELI